MMLPELQSVAEMAIGRVVNSLPEGLLIALFAWMMLRLLPRQNSGTRFAVWFVALLAIAGLPFIGAGAAHTFLAAGTVPPLITLSGRWGTWLLLCWLAVAGFALLRLAIGLWRLRALRRSCVAIDADELDASVRQMIANLNSSSFRVATLATSECVTVPAVIGFFEPVIILPAWALRELPAEELNIILLHEFAHLRRWDDWTNLLQKMVRAIFFFHPAVWWIESRLSLEREMACDDQVLAKMGNPRGYAKCLISLLEKSVARRGLAMAQALVHRARESTLRVAQILDASRPNSKHVWKPALGLVGIFSLVCIAVVPSAPKFVAFSGDAPASSFDGPRVQAMNRDQFPSAAVVPATLRASTVPALAKTSKRLTRPVTERSFESPTERRTENNHSAPEVVPAQLNVRLNVNTKPNQAAVVKASIRDEAVPAEAVFVIRTTEQVGPNEWMWSVTVWRVNLVTPSESAKAPVASRT
jgi:beta-lactamase regulating signal transducer with metallopeptidase domain